MVGALKDYKGPRLEILGPLAKDGGIVYKDCRGSGKVTTYKKLARTHAFLLRMAFVCAKTKGATYKFKSLIELAKAMTVADVPDDSPFLTPTERKTTYNHFWSLDYDGDGTYTTPPIPRDAVATAATTAANYSFILSFVSKQNFLSFGRSHL